MKEKEKRRESQERFDQRSSQTTQGNATQVPHGPRRLPPGSHALAASERAPRVSQQASGSARPSPARGLLSGAPMI